MRVAIDQVKSGRAHACVSAGNTGALMGTAKFVLKTLPGIDRPAICAVLPTRKGRVYALDLGANADCTPSTCSSSPSWVPRSCARWRGSRARPWAAQHRLRGDQGQRGGEEGRRALARHAHQLPRQRGGRRHLQGHHRRRGVRRLRRQRGAQDLRGPRQDAGRLPQGGVHPQLVDQGARRYSPGPSSGAFATAWTTGATTARRCWD
jgi:hypothetical protein